MFGTTDRPRPTGLREVTLLMCLFNVVCLFVIQPRGLSSSALLLLCGTMVVISFVVLWYFWLGRNWARWLVLATSVLALANLTLLGSLELAEKVLIVAEAALAVWLLVWLNTRAVRAFFSWKGKPDVA